MRVFIGVIFVFTLSLAAVYIVYLILGRQRPKAKRRVKPKAKLKAKTSQKASFVKPLTQAAFVRTQTPTLNRYELPPGIPRDINTIKIIAQEDPDIIIGIIRKWMRER